MGTVENAADDFNGAFHQFYEALGWHTHYLLAKIPPMKIIRFIPWRNDS
jgi:hypothetical protein